MDGEVLLEVPPNLQMLIRLVVRGFYGIEDVLIIDMLVRNCCMSEDDLCDLLKFDRKMLRQRINTLRADKFIQSRHKMVTQEEGKTQKEQYYFINYKSFVNVIKYKLDHIRKKLEMEERDQTSRASFICQYCQRSYTDLEADQLLDPLTGQLLCIICKQEVQEDMSGMPRHDTRLVLQKFNEQMEPLFNLLREVENIKLAAKFSEPQPKDFSDLKKPGQPRPVKPITAAESGGKAWSGDATKKSGFHVEGSIDVNINATETEETVLTKENPIWLSEATSLITTNITSSELSAQQGENKNAPLTSSQEMLTGGDDDVMKLLQAHERKKKKNGNQNSDSDSDDSGDEAVKKKTENHQPTAFGTDTRADPDMVELMDSDDDDTVPLVSVAGEKVSFNEVDSAMIARMTHEEKNAYMLIYQDLMGSLED
ncbi:general transcription factor IIE subunit 1 [Palaemon carinicauda]|uniref:general transcription factor IIE subunit 1 n=1 Tax=Palaemon carinicauda TaxID=392227 RepID=UPI0035B63685